MQLSNDAKIAYALLKDRLELSIKNNWFDENEDIYFIFTNEKLITILNCHDGKLTKIKKELSKADLLEQVRCGQGKPNKLYLNNPAITKKDVYEIKKQEEPSVEPSHDDEMLKSHTNDTELSNTKLNKLVAIKETSKYSVKSSDFLTSNQEKNQEIVKDLEQGLYRKRMLSYGGLLKQKHKILNLDDSEEGNLINTSDEKTTEEEQKAHSIMAIWNYQKQNYYIKK